MGKKISDRLLMCQQGLRLFCTFCRPIVASVSGRKEKYPLLVETFNQALTLAEEDLRDHWASYRANYLQEVDKHGAR
jgi:hypothetical protein